MKPALIDIVFVVGQESLHLGLVEGRQAAGLPRRLDLPHHAADGAWAVGAGAEPIAAAVEAAESLADGVGRAVVVIGDAAGVAAAGARNIHVTAALTGLGGGDEGGDDDEGGVELHFGRVWKRGRERSW